MQNKSFLDFDISVASDKKRRSKKNSAKGGFESSVRTCQFDGCSDEAKYRAPKSPKNLENFHYNVIIANMHEIYNYFNKILVNINNKSKFIACSIVLG